MTVKIYFTDLEGDVISVLGDKEGYVNEVELGDGDSFNFSFLGWHLLKINISGGSRGYVLLNDADKKVVDDLAKVNAEVYSLQRCLGVVNPNVRDLQDLFGRKGLETY